MVHMIRCGWCGAGTAHGHCEACGRDPVIPWEQRGLRPPEFDPEAEKTAEQQALLAGARRALTEAGEKVTNAALAEQLGIDERTVRRWMSGK